MGTATRRPPAPLLPPPPAPQPALWWRCGCRDPPRGPSAPFFLSESRAAAPSSFPRSPRCRLLRQLRSLQLPRPRFPGWRFWNLRGGQRGLGRRFDPMEAPLHPPPVGGGWSARTGAGRGQGDARLRQVPPPPPARSPGGRQPLSPAPTSCLRSTGHLGRRGYSPPSSSRSSPSGRALRPLPSDDGASPGDSGQRSAGVNRRATRGQRRESGRYRFCTGTREPDGK